MGKQFYAAYRPYGIFSLNIDGNRADKLVGFPSRAARDAWVADDPERREPVTASSSEVRAALRLGGRTHYNVVRTPAEFAAGE
jgi:hypothetical protein